MQALWQCSAMVDTHAAGSVIRHDTWRLAPPN